MLGREKKVDIPDWSIARRVVVELFSFVKGYLPNDLYSFLNETLNIEKLQK